MCLHPWTNRDGSLWPISYISLFDSGRLKRWHTSVRKEKRRERERWGGGRGEEREEVRVKRRSTWLYAHERSYATSRRSISLTMATIFRRDSIIHMRAARIWPVDPKVAGLAKTYTFVRCYVALRDLFLYQYSLGKTITSISKI